MGPQPPVNMSMFAVKCEVAGMRVSTSKTEAMAFFQRNVVFPFRLGWVRVRWWCSADSDVGILLHCHDKEGAH